MRPSRPTGMEGNEAGKKIKTATYSLVQSPLKSIQLTTFSLMHTIAASMKAVLFYQILKLMYTVIHDRLRYIYM